MNLTSERKPRLLSRPYEGAAIRASQLLHTPMRITAFEIVPSPRNKGKRLLVAQAEWDDHGTRRTAPLMTESYQLIKDIEGTEQLLPHTAKLTRDRNGYLRFTALNQKEIKELSNI